MMTMFLGFKIEISCKQKQKNNVPISIFNTVYFGLCDVRNLCHLRSKQVTWYDTICTQNCDVPLKLLILIDF